MMTASQKTPRHSIEPAHALRAAQDSIKLLKVKELSKPFVFDRIAVWQPVNF